MVALGREGLYLNPEQASPWCPVGVTGNPKSRPPPPKARGMTATRGIRPERTCLSPSCSSHPQPVPEGFCPERCSSCATALRPTIDRVAPPPPLSPWRPRHRPGYPFAGEIRRPVVLRFSCPQCGQRLKVSEERAGGSVVCPRCGAPSVVPAAGATE